MQKVLWRGNHTLKFRSFRLYQKWPSVSYISGMRQYSARPLRGFLARANQLISALKSALLDSIKHHQDVSRSKTKPGGTRNFNNLRSRITGKTIFKAPNILYTIIDRVKRPTTGVKEMDVSTIPTISLTDTPEGIVELIDSLGRSDVPTSPPSVYIDLEGVDIGRKGSIAILQVYILPTKRTFLVDVHNLRGQAFSTPNSSGLTLKAILESIFIPKVIFDVRNDSDALYSHFGIKLQGVIDLQLMELATRSHSQKFLSGLGRCMDQDLVQTPEELEFRSAIKKRGVQLFVPEKGGRYEVFNDRPLDPAIVDYCVQDVQLMPQLWNIYNAKLSLMDKRWATKIERETKARLLLSQSPGFNGKGQHMAKAPDTW